MRIALIVVVIIVLFLITASVYHMSKMTQLISTNSTSTASASATKVLQTGEQFIRDGVATPTASVRRNY